MPDLEALPYHGELSSLQGGAPRRHGFQALPGEPDASAGYLPPAYDDPYSALRTLRNPPHPARLADEAHIRAGLSRSVFRINQLLPLELLHHIQVAFDEAIINAGLVLVFCFGLTWFQDATLEWPATSLIKSVPAESSAALTSALS
jgi:hypothetical protein